MHDEKREDLPELGRNNDKKQIEKSFVTQAAIISVSNFVVKIIGVVYKIPLSRILNDSMGVFNAAYSIYAMLFMISTAGLPVAVSKLVAASNERGRQREADKVYRVCLIIFGLIGLICTAFM
ncbi:MAG: oligosaccharide flippase family protein, partial [Clostridia bacterium]|nr:oligosaccharide flippase family protein [Clostridia bacterium]